MKFDQSVHGAFDHFAELQLVGITEVFQHVFESVSDAARKIDRHRPAFPVFIDMVEEKIVEPVFNDIFDHEMPAIFRKEHGEVRQVFVGQWFLVNILQYFG